MVRIKKEQNECFNKITDIEHIDLPYYIIYNLLLLLIYLFYSNFIIIIIIFYYLNNLKIFLWK